MRDNVSPLEGPAAAQSTSSLEGSSGEEEEVPAGGEPAEEGSGEEGTGDEESEDGAGAVPLLNVAIVMPLAVGDPSLG